MNIDGLEPGARLLACSALHPPKLARFEQPASNGYTWIAVREPDETVLVLWPTAQLKEIGEEG